ncbi:MAG TPA: ABC transporter permease [Terriglobia bacterium]|nr:ABC transporter permease [Terriglobia bacterium]
MNVIRLAIMTIRLVMRTKVALFFTFLFPCIFLFIYAGIFAHGNPNAVAYMFGQVLTLNILGAGFFGLGLQAVMQRERGTLRRYRLAPVSSLTIVASNLLANYLIQIPVVGLLLVCAMGVFHMPFKFSFIPMIFFLLTIGIFAFAGYGLTLASVSNTMQEVQVYNNLAWFALVFLSGISIPLPALPHWIQTVATFLPATYLVSMFQAVMSQSEPITAHIPELMTLVVSGSAGLFIAWKLFRWEKEERIAASNKIWALALLVPIILMGAWMNIYANPSASWQKSYSMMLKQMSAAMASSSAAPEKPLEDFEGAAAAQDISKIWKASVDDANQPARVSLISPGANGTQHALRVHGGVSGLGRNHHTEEASGSLVLPATMKNYNGIEFWIRSDGTRDYRFTLAEEGGKQETTPEVTLTPSSKWESVRIPAPPSEPQPSHLLLFITPLGPAGNFSVDIDEIKIY